MLANGSEVDVDVLSCWGGVEDDLRCICCMVLDIVRGVTLSACLRGLPCA